MKKEITYLFGFLLLLVISIQSYIALTDDSFFNLSNTEIETKVSE